MPTTKRTYRGQEATVTFTDAGIPVGILQNWELTVEWEFADLRGAGSPKRQDDQKTAVDVSISAEWAEWSEEGYIKVVDFDEGNDQLDETADVAHFDVELSIPSSDGGNTITPTVENVRFPSPSLSADPDSWVTLGIEGEGDDVSGLVTA